MAITPNSTVYLLDTPLDNEYKNQLRFTSISSQASYFMSKKKHEFNEVTYQRKDNVIKVPKHIDSLWNVNYVMYQNTDHTNKWFYAFITKMVYMNENMTEVYIETDVYQTWLFNVELKPSFVVREHVSDDTIGKHLVDEQLETGEYKQEDFDKSDQLGTTYFILGVSDNSPLGDERLVGNIYGKVPTGLTYWVFENNSTGITWLKDTIKKYTDAGKVDAISILFTVPEIIIDSVVNSNGWNFNQAIPSDNFYGFKVFNKSKKLNNLDGYIPKNNKMFIYPYKFLYVSNQDGLSATYRYEDFSTPNMQFAVYGGLCPDPKLKLAPFDYKGEGLNNEHGLILSGFPLGSWATDTYNAWLASNGGSTAIAMIGSASAVIGGIATGNLLAVGGGALGVAHQLTQIHQASIQPDQAKGQVGGGNLMFSTNSLDFYFYYYTIKEEYAKRIDDYFTMYGYKVNTLKTPETHSRQNWNYIKTIDVNIVGSVPAEDMNRLRKIYDDGVTLWHNPSNIMNYSVSNNIV